MQAHEPSPNEQLSLLDGYNASADVNTWDEMYGSSPDMLPHWNIFANYTRNLKDGDWANIRSHIQRLLQENGATYHIYGDPQGFTRPWKLDSIPLIVNHQDWQQIESALQQRARLLDLILQDIYGNQKLIRQGLIPAELIFAHPGFHRAAAPYPRERHNQLIFYAADLLRYPGGDFRILADRCQAPSGAGYALENRAVISRAMPDLVQQYRIARLGPFFEAMHHTLAHLSPHDPERPRIVVLTPGQMGETYFEHAYLAAKLGYTLTQGDDLTVREGRVWLKAVDGLHQVNVIQRRVDDGFCDPLELREDSFLGIPGLMEALRRRSVAIANPIGSSVVENPGLLPFLPVIAKHLLGEELEVPSVATWWCGAPKGLDYVLNNLANLIIKPISPEVGHRSFHGGALCKTQMDEWRAIIKARPHLYVGQEMVQFSTAPSLNNHQVLEARRVVLRSFLVSQGQDYLVMPGGLTRCASAKDTILVVNQAGALGKDTWVLEQESPPPIPLLQSMISNHNSDTLSSRAADHIFWVGRYLERAEGNARILFAAMESFSEFSEHGAISPAQSHIFKVLSGCFSLPDDHFTGEQHYRIRTNLLQVLVDAAQVGSVASTVNALLNATYGAREYWSATIWRLLERVQKFSQTKTSAREIPFWQANDMLLELIDTLAAFGGLCAETLPQDQAWRFLDLGRRIERSTAIIYTLIPILKIAEEQQQESDLLLRILRSTDNLVSYRRKYQAETRLPEVLDLLLWDTDNPRSLAYQLNTARNHLRHFPKQQKTHRRDTPAHRLLTADHLLFVCEQYLPDDGSLPEEARAELMEKLEELAEILGKTSEAIAWAWFSHTETPQRLAPKLRLPEG